MVEYTCLTPGCKENWTVEYEFPINDDQDVALKIRVYKSKGYCKNCKPEKGKDSQEKDGLDKNAQKKDAQEKGGKAAESRKQQRSS